MFNRKEPETDFYFQVGDKYRSSGPRRYRVIAVPRSLVLIAGVVFAIPLAFSIGADAKLRPPPFDFKYMVICGLALLGWAVLWSFSSQNAFANLLGLNAIPRKPQASTNETAPSVDDSPSVPVSTTGLGAGLIFCGAIFLVAWLSLNSAHLAAYFRLGLGGIFIAFILVLLFRFASAWSQVKQTPSDGVPPLAQIQSWQRQLYCQCPSCRMSYCVSAIVGNEAYDLDTTKPGIQVLCQVCKRQFTLPE